MPSRPIRTTALRLPADLHELASTLARKKGMSFNAFVAWSLERVAREEEEHELFEGYTIAGGGDDSTTEWAMPAAAEVVLLD